MKRIVRKYTVKGLKSNARRAQTNNRTVLRDQVGVVEASRGRRQLAPRSAQPPGLSEGAENQEIRGFCAKSPAF